MPQDLIPGSAPSSPSVEPALSRLHGHLVRLYGEDTAGDVLPRFTALLDAFRRDHRRLGLHAPSALDASDVLLITYGDQVRERGRPPLRTLQEFLTAHLHGVVTGVHLLPHYPASSDDGFAVVDHHAVDPLLGDWRHVGRLAADFRLMADALVNHTSAESPWFLGWRYGDPRFADFYRTVEPASDRSQVTRPRENPLLTPFPAPDGTRWVWTTFGPDQPDLDYRNPEVLLRMTAVLLTYIARGARMLRLDAVAYLWKVLGTACAHLPETHEVVKVWRTVVDAVAPGTMLVTGAKAPPPDHASYFGAGDEAHLVTQFPLPPLALAAYRSRDASTLQGWLRELPAPPPGTAFLNVLGCHDGIDLRPAEGLLGDREITELCATIEHEGGYVTYHKRPDGTQAPVELHTGFFDALSPKRWGEPKARQIARFVSAQSLLLALQGMPALYFHGLFGSRSWNDGAVHSGRPRVINRQRFARWQLDADLADPTSTRHRVLGALRRRIGIRAGEPAFHPDGPQQVLATGAGTLALERRAPDGEGALLCVHDLSGEPQRFRAGPAHGLAGGRRYLDLLDGSEHVAEVDGTLDVPLPAYGVRWLRRTA